MRKTNLCKEMKTVAAGVLGALVIFGANTALAAAAVDAAGAEQIAFADAGVTVDMAERVRTKAERENGENIYEVSFTVDGVEYDYLIREDDGAILEWEMDGRDLKDAAAEESLKDSLEEIAESGDTSSGKAGAPIGLEQAKEIALSDAGLTAADVRFSKIKFENDDREVVYEVEFYQDRQEYEYEIDAYSGTILKMERD